MSKQQSQRQEQVILNSNPLLLPTSPHCFWRPTKLFSAKRYSNSGEWINYKTLRMPNIPEGSVNKHSNRERMFVFFPLCHGHILQINISGRIPCNRISLLILCHWESESSIREVAFWGSPSFLLEGVLCRYFHIIWLSLSPSSCFTQDNLQKHNSAFTFHLIP